MARKLPVRDAVGGRPGIMARPMRDVVETLTGFEGRGACTDAERRAAVWLHDDLRARGYEAWVETVWVRPQWAWMLVWHGALGVVASLVATAVPAVGLAGIVLALSLGLELRGVPVLTRLFYRRATQLVVVEPPAAAPVRLWLVAHTDAPRGGGAFRERWRRWTARAWPGLAWWVVGALLWVVVMGAIRAAGADGGWIGAVQLVPTVALLAAAAVALDVVLSAWTPGASDAGGVAVALALHEELTRRAPARLSVGLVLAGAGEAFPYGFRAWRRAERPAAADSVVVELGPCGSGAVAWTSRHPQLVAAAPGGQTPAHRPTAATRSLPSLYVRTVGAGGVPPRVRTEHDTAAAVDDAALDAVYDFVLEVVDALDESLAR
jgi:hypothetical protein